MFSRIYYGLALGMFCACGEGVTGTPEDTAGDDTGLDAATEAPTRYPADWAHSPMTTSVLHAMDTILAESASNNVFMKAGDSITYSSSYLHCLADADVDLASHADLEETREHFLSGDADGSTPFDRWSHAVQGAKTASWAIAGTPSPLEEEIEAVAPSFAVVMFGTNDAGYYGDDTGQMLRWYGAKMLEMTDTLVTGGVVPVLMTIPPKDGSTYAPRTGVINGVVRGIAQGLQVPLVDYNRVMLGAPSWGLSGDGIHPSATGGGCDFTESGLEYGYNIRNLMTLDALDRSLRALDGAEEAFDAVQPRAAGAGSPEDPIQIDQFPFTRMSDTSLSGHYRYDDYPACDAGQDESGPDEHFRLILEEDTALRIAVIDREGVDVDIQLLLDDGSDTCLERDDTLIEGTLSAGEYRVVVDSYVGSAAPESGGYVLVAVACDEGDEDCAAPIE